MTPYRTGAVLVALGILLFAGSIALTVLPVSGVASASDRAPNFMEFRTRSDPGVLCVYIPNGSGTTLSCVDTEPRG